MLSFDLRVYKLIRRTLNPFKINQESKKVMNRHNYFFLLQALLIVVFNQQEVNKSVKVTSNKDEVLLEWFIAPRKI